MEYFSEFNNLAKIEIVAKIFFDIYHPNLSVISPVIGGIFFIKRHQFLVLGLNFVPDSTYFIQNV